MHWHEVLKTQSRPSGRHNTKGEYIMDEKTQKVLEQIAMEESLVLAECGGLDYRGIDKDLAEVSIMTLRVMLARAYELGRNSKP